MLSWHAADVEKKFPAPTTFEYTTMTVDTAATFYDVVYAAYLANEPWKERGVSSCPSRCHKVAFDHFPGIEGEDLRDAEQKKKRHADQAAGKKKRDAAALDAREDRRGYNAARGERLRGYIGRRVRIWWNSEEYYDGVVESWLGEYPSLGLNIGRHVIHYDDNTREKLDLRDRSSTRWEFLPDAPPAKKPKGLREERIEALNDKAPDPW